MNTLRTSSTRSSKRGYFAKHPWAALAALFVLLAVVCAASVCMGATQVSLSQMAASLLGKDPASSAYKIVWFVRLPRTGAAVLAGLALAVSGTIIQAVLNNALAGPNIIGVNAGAGLSTLLCAVLFPSMYAILPAAAFIGALVACLIIYAVAYKTGASRITIVLAGVAISSIFSAGIDTITTLYPDVVVGASSFMMGGLANVTAKALGFAVWYILIGFALAWALSFEMNVLALGDETAASLGLHIQRVRFVLIVLAALLAGAAVSFAGLLGFVGLIVPHAARFLLGNDHRYLVPASALLGAAFVAFCDLLSRILFAPYELPVGILMSFIGGPFFIYLILKKKRGRMHD